MTLFEVTIRKIKTNFENPIIYYTNYLSEIIIFNELLNKKIKITHTGFECFNCKKNKKILTMGYCFDCFSKVPQTGDYILRPELSKAHLGIEDRDLEYEKETQLQPHIVYLANSGGLKIGVTRESQIPTRWIDQGAEQTIPFFRTPNRYLAGMIEVEYKQYLSDKTNWKKMLSQNADYIDLVKEKHDLEKLIPQKFKEYYLENQEIYSFIYPIISYPKKITSVSLNKISEFEGILKGIKGQYLIFDNFVFNWRSHEGYNIKLDVII